MRTVLFLTAAAVIGVAAAPASAQYQQPYPYPQPYPQTYPQQYPGYGYPQGYGYGQGGVGQIIDQLLGNRYNVTDRRAVSQCAAAATAQAQNQYRGYGYQQQGYGYQQGFAQPAMRVTAITDVQRRSNGLRVRGLLSSGYGGGYGSGYGQYGYQNQQYAMGDLSFRCNVDYRGVVTNVRISRNDGYRRY
ncbi:MAG: hypothetical protein ACJ8FL_06000 [Sphingomicrobium sp.]